MRHRPNAEALRGATPPLSTALLLMALVAGCAAAPAMKDEAPAAEPAPHEDGLAPDQDRAEVERLSAEIAAMDPEGDEALGVEGGAPDEGGAAAAAGSCQKVCESSEAICASSTKICTIAERHAAEPFFAERCSWSQKECNEAGAACVGCSG